MSSDFSTKITKVKTALEAVFIKKADIKDNLTSTDTDKPLSAKQGKQLNDNKASITHTHGNLQNDGSVGTSNNSSKNVVTDSNGKITTEAKPTIDNTVTQSSNNAVKSSGIYSALQNKIEESDLLNLIYPIGSIYMEKSTNAHSICPIQTTLGGTWTRIENRFLYASENGQGIGTTDGSETVTLTENQIPSHNHTQSSHNHGSGDSTYPNFMTTNINIAVGQTKRNLPSTGSNYYFVYSTEKGDIGQHSVTDSKQPAIQNTGGGQAHDNMPPYIIVNVWERTA